MKPIYFDHAATTPVHPEVVQAMLPVLENVFGNPSSVHHFGRQARKVIDEARETLASSIGANEKEIVLTGGGTESNNLAIIGTALKHQSRGKHIITTAIEHHASLHAAEFLEKQGFDVTYLPVDESGRVSSEEIRRNLREDTILVSVMFVNNETGILQPIREIGEILRDHQAYFFTDAVQAYGAVPIDVEELGVDLLSVSAHKIYGPKGIGFLYVREGTLIQPLQQGGEQERKRRAGTENTAAARGFQKAVELLMIERKERNETYRSYKRLFLQILKDEGISYSLNGDQQYAVPGIVNISFPGIHVEAFLTNLDLSNVAASSGSACTAGSVDPSHVLAAMFDSDDLRTRNSVRFSFGLDNQEEDIREGATRVAQIVRRLTS
ncbi:cysteine desulfurase [Melghiribacillus thermohalophilus]|uniref:cysteine desulfurase n=1 Tax=Melghiribacillus thermohalophilus TaxID=1324956 RepID=A0A4R3NC81_9BACI|nr:cysteine desulfurase family protein [Melghiribacillus thermohalophilus]TCT27084.1 cysteine desulfurase [Melghiribacillus thermohalophilus]